MKTRDLGPKDPRIGTLGHRTRNPGSCPVKIKKSLASKRDNAKDPF